MKSFRGYRVKNIIIIFFIFSLIFHLTLYSQDFFNFKSHNDDIFWNIFYLIFSQNPILSLNKELSNFKKQNSGFVIPIIVKKNKDLLEKIAFYNENEIYNYLYSYNYNKDKALKVYVESLKYLYMKNQTKLYRISDFIKKNYNQDIYIFYTMFQINKRDTEFYFSNFYFFSSNIDLRYIFYKINKFVIKNYFKNISILPRIIVFSRTDREYFKQIFLIDYQREMFEEILSNYISDLILSKLKFINFNNLSYLNDIENRLYFIKFTPYNQILKMSDNLIDDNNKIPYPRTFGKKIIDLIKQRKLPYNNIKDFINLGFDNTIGILYFPQIYKNTKKNNKLKSILKDYIQSLYHIRLVEFDQYLSNYSKFYNKKIIKLYFGNSNNNPEIRHYFNSEGNKKSFNFEIYTAENKEGGIFFNFSNLPSVVFLNYSDNSLYLRMIKDFKSIKKPYRVYSRSFFKRIIDKVVYFLNMIF